jgi:hypothetical protein
VGSAPLAARTWRDLSSGRPRAARVLFARDFPRRSPIASGGDCPFAQIIVS